MDSSSTYPQNQPLTEDQLALISQHTERAARKALKRYSIGALAGFLILLGGVGIALDGKSDAAEAAATNRAATVSICERLNIVRAQSNISDLVSFRILSLSAQREKKLGDAAAVKRAGTDNIHTISAMNLANEAKNLTIIGLTDCSKAVDYARTYNFPTAQPIGNPSTGELYPLTQAIVDASRKTLAAEARDNKG